MAWAFFERAAGFKICSDAGCPERVAADLDLHAEFGRAALDHAPGVDPVHRRGRERARAADGRAEQGALVVAGDGGGTNVLAKAFGDAVRQVGIPVGKVYTSKYNRAYETAVIAGFKDIEKTADLTEGGLVVSPNENNRRIEAFHKMLGTAPQPGTNTILITHKPNIVDGLGKDWFDVKEGEASLFRPENGSYKLVVRVQMEEWPDIAVAAK
jgi:hypothetical protein